MCVRAEEELVKARRRVEEAQRIVWEQKGRIARLQAVGFDTLSTEKTLRLLEANLQTFREHVTALEYAQASSEDSPLALPPRLLAAE
jgi:hypothetical protein